METEHHSDSIVRNTVENISQLFENKYNCKL